MFSVYLYMHLKFVDDSRRGCDVIVKNYVETPMSVFATEHFRVYNSNEIQ